jgi:GNAT superfamily N-acetyltransferase
MSIKQAYKEDLQVVKYITIGTINQIYPHYYPKGAVEFFVEHHNDTNILSDIEAGKVFLCVNEEGQSVGTVSIKENDICRLFVLPEYQGKGYGRKLLDFAENEITKKYEEIMIDASLPAKRIYLKRGYREKESHIINANYGDFLCYDIMVKRYD